MSEVLSPRELNRATLARQFLLARERGSALDTIEHLGGMQSQAPLAPYIGLWTRLRDFDALELATLTETRQVVRLPIMRGTVHLVSARDCLQWRTLFSPLYAAVFNAQFRRGIDGVDRDLLLARARKLFDDKPRTRAEMGKILAQDWPDADPNALAYAVTHHLALCQVPPRGVWNKSGAPRWAPVDDWLGAPLRSASVEDVVLRYLGAFGPAMVADVQQWSGLARLREVVERLPLREFRGESGQVLYDLPDAPLPDGDMPAPPRFLPAYDNLLLSYKDRTRVIADARPVPLPPGNGTTAGTFLVDGVWHGIWQIAGHALRMRPFNRLARADHDALIAEAARLGEFLAPQTSLEPVIEISR